MKKVFSLFVFTLSFIFISMTSIDSLSGINIDVEVVQRQGCVDGTFDAMEDMLDLGFSASQAGCVGNLFYAECTGWLVTVQDYHDCLN